MKQVYVWVAAAALLAASLPAQAQTQVDSGLTAFIDILLQSNPDIIASQRDVDIRQAQDKEARAGFMPTANLSASTYYSTVDQSGLSSTRGTSADITLDIEQPIFRGWRTTAETERAKSLVLSEKKRLKQVTSGVVLDAIIAYANAERDRALLDLRRKNEGVLEHEETAASERFALGEITQTDVSQAKSRLARAQSERIQAEGNLQSSLAGFEAVVGALPPDHLSIPDIDFGFPATLDGVLEAAGAINPAIDVKTYERAAAEQAIRAAHSETYPHLSAFAAYSRKYDPQPTLSDDIDTGSIGLRANLKIYEGGAVQARIHSARAAESRKRQEIVKIKRTVREQAIKRWETYNAANAEMILRVAQVQASERALDGVREESRMGERTILDVLNASQEVIDAQAALAVARRNQIVANFSLADSLDRLTQK